MKQISLLFTLIFAWYLLPAQVISTYRDASLPPEQRASLLLSEMNLSEKIAQLCFINAGNALQDGTGNMDPDKVKQRFPDGIGAAGFNQVRMPMEQAMMQNQAFQKVMLEKTRLGIPCLFIGEGLHGFMAVGSTSFPQAIALGCTWDTTLLENIFSATASEMRSRGFHQALSPVIDLAREPRWGRTEETYSEDPYLTSRLAKAAVLGFQGRKNTIDENHVISTLKHFAGHGQGEGGNNTAPILCDERYFRENHLYPFEIAVKEGNVQSVMPSYNEWSAIPNHSNPWLLKEVLKNEWGFKGYVISDQGGVEDLYRKHAVAENQAHATKMALSAGVDLELMDVESFYSKLHELVNNGQLRMQQLNEAVLAVLTVKFRLGLFEHPYPDPEKARAITNCSQHRQLALTAAHESIVLLKNDNQLLPLDPEKIGKLAVIGPNAADIHWGGYSIEPRFGTSVLEGIRKFADGKFMVEYAEGCRITYTPGSFWDDNNSALNNAASDRKLIEEARKTALASDVILLVLGENESICREGWSENHRGDRDELSLWGLQAELANEMLKTGKPVILLLINGRPITLHELTGKMPAILEGWYLGQETGTAVADILFGKINPSGKLSVTIPKNIGQLPFYYSKKPTRNRNYLNTDMHPDFPFGHGLSYTTFEYGEIVLSNTEMSAIGSITASVPISNTGKMKGTEIVQLYLHDLVCSVTRPIMELKDFARITLEPGESVIVRFTITPEKLRFYNREMVRVVEPGKFEVMIGSSSEEVNHAFFNVIAP